MAAGKCGDGGNDKLLRIEGLAQLINLQTIEVSGDELTTIDSLSALVNLQALLIKNTKLSAIEGLGALTNLRRLQLLDNDKLKVIEGLEKLGNLDFVEFRGPYAVAALAMCARLPALRTITLEDRPQLRKAAEQLQKLRKQQDLPQVDIYFLPDNPQYRAD